MKTIIIGAVDKDAETIVRSGMATFSSLAIFQTITKDTAITGDIGNVRSEDTKYYCCNKYNGTSKLKPQRQILMEISSGHQLNL